MSKANISMTEQLEIDEIGRFTQVCGGSNTAIVLSEPGCGKSSLLAMYAESQGDQWRHPGEYFPSDKNMYIYLDCPMKDVPDIVAPIPDRDTKQVESYVGSLFKMADTRPKIIMADEFMKTPKMMQTMFTRLFLERSVGDIPLPKNSVVFATSNNSSDGVGDNMLAHAGNRVTILRMRKPSAKKWVQWANDNGISSLLRAWAALNPDAFESYTELSDDAADKNPYIFNPRRQNLSFLSPRSLAKCDPIVKNRAILGERTVNAALAGTVGKAAAHAISAFFLIEKDLIPVRKIISDPMGVPMTDNAGAKIMIIFNSIDEIETDEDLTAFMKYVDREKSEEYRALFYSSVTQSKKTVKLAKNNKALSDYIIKNFHLFT
jgi:hypothetical protein